MKRARLTGGRRKRPRKPGARAERPAIATGIGRQRATMMLKQMTSTVLTLLKSQHRRIRSKTLRRRESKAASAMGGRNAEEKNPRVCVRSRDAWRIAAREGRGADER